MTEWDEEEERKRSVKFVDNVIPDTRAQLKVLSKSYQVSYVQSSISLLQDSVLQLLGDVFCFHCYQNYHVCKKPQ